MVQNKNKIKTFDGKFTEVELELMLLLWRLKEGTVAEVMELLPHGRDLAYTSVSTILRILEQKGALKTRKEGRGHIYIPNIQKVDYESRSLKDVVEKVFQGTPVSLVKQLLDTCSLDQNELDEIKNLISQMQLKSPKKDIKT